MYSFFTFYEYEEIRRKLSIYYRGLFKGFFRYYNLLPHLKVSTPLSMKMLTYQPLSLVAVIER